MTAYRVVDDHKDLDNIGSVTHEQLDDFVNTSPFVVVSGSLGQIPPNARFLSGSGLTITDGGPGGTLLLTVSGTGGTGVPGGSDTQVQFNDGNVFGGDPNFTFNKATNTLSVDNLSGSLTKLVDGTSYLIAGPNVTIVTGSNGAVTIAANGPLSTRWLEVVNGEADGINTTFTLSNVPSPATSVMLFINGVLQRLGPLLDYTVAGSTINTNWTPNSGSHLLATYQYQITTTTGNTKTWTETPVGSVNGINNIFTITSVPYPYDTLIFFVNGVLQKPGIANDYVAIGNTLTLNFAPNANSNLTAVYQAPGLETAWMDSVFGTVDGINNIFTLPNVPVPASSIMFFVNGVLQSQGTGSDYTLLGNTVTMNYVPNVGSILTATYTYQPPPPTGNNTQLMEVPSGDVDGVNMVFTIANTPIPSDSLMFFINGVLQRQGLAYDYTLAGTTITTVTAPPSGSTILVSYPY